MAIKDQCSNCTLFNQAFGICSKVGNSPMYDNHSCGDYSRIGGNINLNKGGSIDLSKPGDSSSPAPQSPSPVQQSPTTPSRPASPSPQSSPAVSVSGRLFAHPFSFNGRIRRLEFNLSYLIYIVWYLLYMAFLETESTFLIMLCLVSLIPAFWFFIAQAAKRCHDRGNSGFFIFIPCYLLWLMFAEGDSGANSYGPDPKM